MTADPSPAADARLAAEAACRLASEVGAALAGLEPEPQAVAALAERLAAARPGAAPGAAAVAREWVALQEAAGLASAADRLRRAEELTASLLLTHAPPDAVAG